MNSSNSWAHRRWWRTTPGSTWVFSTPNWRWPGARRSLVTGAIDTVALARVRHPGAKNSLDALCTRYGIDRSHRTKHGALLDAELLAQVYVELTGGRQIGLELAAQRAEAEVVTLSVVRRERAFRKPRPHTASEEELANHAAFLNTIKSPLWLD